MQMNGIVKTIKSVQYLQLHNKPVQTLTNLNSIGLLTHLMSLPDTWVIRKTQLYEKFGRAAVSHAFKELETEGYLISIKYRDGKKNGYAYFISDVSFTTEQVKQIVDSVEFPILEISGDGNQHLIEKSVKSCDFEVSNFNSSSSAAQNEHLIKEIKINELLKKEILVSSSREEIDRSLKDEFPNKPFEEIKQNLITDPTVVIETDSQYKSMLKYRLKNSKAPKAKKSTYKKSFREEIIPEWFEKSKVNVSDEESKMNSQELAIERAKLIKELNSLSINN